MPSKIGKYEVSKTLGTGVSCKVKLARNTETGDKVAIKIMHQGMENLIENEISYIRELKHKHVIEMVDEGWATYEKKNGSSKQVYFIVLENAKGGEIFDYINESGPFSEAEARYYFKQLLDGLDYCHRIGLAHRDLKPENLLMDRNFDLKIDNFGFAAPVEGRQGDGFLWTHKGTENYMAPEIHEGKGYRGREVDLFSAAIILFIMVTQHPPFTYAKLDDPFF